MAFDYAVIIKPFQEERMVSKTVLNNGITVLTEQMQEFNSCSVGIWVNAGSRYENEKQAGISHFLEHMFFKGTENRSAVQISQDMDGVGGQLNAFTEKETTCFYARIIDKHLDKACDILADMMFHSVFDEAEMEREKKVVLEEIKMCEDSPDDVVFEMFGKALWDGHPLGKPILGAADTVSSFSREDLLNYIGAYYRPERIVVSAAGSVDHDTFVKIVEGWPAKLSAEPNLTLCPGGMAKPCSVSSVRYRDTEQLNMCYGVPGLSASDERRYALHVLDSVLGGSMSCRLFREIRELRGLAYSVGTFMNSYRDCGNYGVYAGTSPDNADVVMRLIREILDDVRQNGITSQELARAKEHVKGTMALGLESTSNRMIRLARSEMIHGRFISPEEFLQKIDAVTGEEVLETAQSVLNPEKFVLAALGPCKEVDGIPAASYSEKGSVESDG